MYFILLDDGFFENYVANRDYINLLVDFLCNYTNINFIFFHPFNQSKSQIISHTKNLSLKMSIIAT